MMPAAGGVKAVSKRSLAFQNGSREAYAIMPGDQSGYGAMDRGPAGAAAGGAMREWQSAQVPAGTNGSAPARDCSTQAKMARTPNSATMLLVPGRPTPGAARDHPRFYQWIEPSSLRNVIVTPVALVSCKATFSPEQVLTA